jgi:hypothetical protein
MPVFDTNVGTYWMPCRIMPVSFASVQARRARYTSSTRCSSSMTRRRTRRMRGAHPVGGCIILSDQGPLLDPGQPARDHRVVGREPPSVTSSPTSSPSAVREDQRRIHVVLFFHVLLAIAACV